MSQCTSRGIVNGWFRRIPASWNFEPIYLLNTDISIWYQCNIFITKSLAHISDIILRGWTDISPRGHPGPINFTGYQSFIIAKHSAESATCSVFALGSGQWNVIMFTRFSSCSDKVWGQINLHRWLFSDFFAPRLLQLYRLAQKTAKNFIKIPSNAHINFSSPV